MGMIMSKDTRRISFENTFALSSAALAVSKSIENETITGFDDITPSNVEDLMFSEKTVHTEFPDEEEGDYWARRIENLKKEHQIINKIVETEYDKQMERTEKLFASPKIISEERMIEIKPCFDWRAKILNCYEANPHQPLVCSSYVEAFANCVASCRGG